MNTNLDKILITDVHTAGHLGVVRAFIDSSYFIIAMSHNNEALGLASGVPDKKVICPTYQDPNFCGWFEEWLLNNPIDMIIPSEGFLWATKSIFKKISHLIPIQNDPEFIYKYINKYDYFEKFIKDGNSNISAHCPETIFVNEHVNPTVEDLKKLTLPAFIKVDGAYSSINNNDQVIKVENYDELLLKINDLKKTTSLFSIQGFVPGKKATVNLLHINGEILCSTVVLAEHETPYTGGVTSLRKTWHHDEMLNDAILKAKFLGWNGVMMIEYRYDEAANSIHLIEFNLRFWAALHLCLYHGVNFPLKLTDSFLNKNPKPLKHSNHKTVARNLTYETGHSLSYLKSANKSIYQKAYKIFGFVKDGLNPNISSDSFYPGDRKVWFYELYYLIKNLLR